MCLTGFLAADADARQRKIQKRLQTIKREERAIKAALESLDHQGDSEDEPGEPGHSESAKPPPDAQQEKQQQLQRATLTNRLQGLWTKRDQLKVDFNASLTPQNIMTGPAGFAAPTCSLGHFMGRTSMADNPCTGF